MREALDRFVMGGGQSRAAQKLRDQLARAAENGDLQQLREGLSRIANGTTEEIRGVDLNLPVKGQFTMLQLAVRAGHLEIVRHLLEVGVEPNRASKHTLTPLHYACEKQALHQVYVSADAPTQIIVTLLRARADACLEASNGCTALDMARNGHHLAAVQALEESLTVWSGQVDFWEISLVPRWVPKFVVVHLDRRPGIGRKAQRAATLQCPTCGSYQTPTPGAAQFSCMATPPLRPGTTVRISDLASAAHLNGSIGVIDSFDQGTGRWHVRLSALLGGELKSLKPENLHADACSTLIMVCPSLQLAIYDSERALWKSCWKRPTLVPLPTCKALVVVSRESIKGRKFGLACKILRGMQDLFAKKVSFRFSTETELARLETVLQDPLVASYQRSIATLPSGVARGQMPMPQGASVQPVQPPFTVPFASDPSISASAPNLSFGAAHATAATAAHRPPTPSAPPLRSASPAEAKCAADPPWQPGMQVRISGLTAAVHLNGSIGTLASLDRDTGRWHVRLSGDSGLELKSLKPSCLHPEAPPPAPAAEVQKEDGKPEVVQCTICMDRPSDSAVVPCGHMCGCHGCLEKIQVSALPHCPLCRGPVTSVIRIYR